MKRKHFLISLLVVLFILFIGIFIITKLSTKEITFTLEDMSLEEVTFKKDQVNLYLFYGDGCPHCEELIQYLNTLPNHLKKQVNLYTFEVWYTETSYQLLMDIGAALDVTPKNIPFLVIGDTYYEGFKKEEEKEIKKAIQEYIQRKNRKDTFKEYIQSKTE